MAEPQQLPLTQTHIVHSDLMDFAFEITMQGPPIDWPEPLPVVYQTDANFGIGFAADVGDSMGGLFGCYTLFNRGGFFNRYVIGSPWICWDHPLVFDYEAAYADANDDLDAVVYLAAG
ncbi:hypothetical protein [Candidatus Poriferisodalis sp.]|uniref:hypothetical protein n=1 Tax=Candidatus Poriferisodalis sp. TaxID=3101277 RepID=UPI003AF52B62